MQQHYICPDGLPPVNGCSHAESFSGRMVAISGQVPLDASGELAGDEPQAQARQVFETSQPRLPRPALAWSTLPS